MAKGSSTPRRSGSNASTSSSSHSAAVQGATRDIKQVLLSLRNSYRANTSVKVQVCLNLSNGTARYAVPTPRRYARFHNTPKISFSMCRSLTHTLFSALRLQH
jgi:hypothetical protein